MAAGAPEHRDAQRCVRLETLESPQQFGRHRPVDRIAFVRPVHRNGEDRAVDRRFDARRIHRRPLRGSMMIPARREARKSALVHSSSACAAPSSGLRCASTFAAQQNAQHALSSLKCAIDEDLTENQRYWRPMSAVSQTGCSCAADWPSRSPLDLLRPSSRYSRSSISSPTFSCRRTGSRAARNASTAGSRRSPFMSSATPF